MQHVTKTYMNFVYFLLIYFLVSHFFYWSNEISNKVVQTFHLAIALFFRAVEYIMQYKAVLTFDCAHEYRNNLFILQNPNVARFPAPQDKPFVHWKVILNFEFYDAVKTEPARHFFTAVLSVLLNWRSSFCVFCAWRKVWSKETGFWGVFSWVLDAVFYTAERIFRLSGLFSWSRAIYETS